MSLYLELLGAYYMYCNKQTPKQGGARKHVVRHGSISQHINQPVCNFIDTYIAIFVQYTGWTPM